MAIDKESETTRGIAYSGGKVAFVPPLKGQNNHDAQTWLREIVVALADEDQDAMIEMLKDPITTDKDHGISFTTAYHFESAVPAKGILPAVNSDYWR